MIYYIMDDCKYFSKHNRSVITNMRVADFFCGGGGFSEGFRQAGFELVFAVDKWEPAVITYKGNKPYVNVIKDDIIRIAALSDEEFETLVPDTEVIIGSPPCQAFSQSNKSGNGDKSLGIQLLEAYLRIIARKKFKNNSILKYWVLENVPNVKKYIKESYTAEELNLSGNFILYTRGKGAGIYNAKNFGAPTNRKRYLCGDFPRLIETHKDNQVIKLKDVLDSLGNPLDDTIEIINDVNYPELNLPRNKVTDHQYIYELAPFEWKTAKRLKQDKGYMGKMSFPENLERPARTVMATMTASSREAMILGYGKNKYRLPTVREAASMMSFPIDYWFYGKSKGIKHTLVGNAVPPKLSYAIAKAIALEAGANIPNHYIPIQHAEEINFTDLNGSIFLPNKERPKKATAKFKYHIPYLIIKEYRVELTNYKSDFNNNNFQWDTEIHYSQGKEKAKVFSFKLTLRRIPTNYRKSITEFLNQYYKKCHSFNSFQKIYCLTSEDRLKNNQIGPHELLSKIKLFINDLIPPDKQGIMIKTGQNPEYLPEAILVGYYILQRITKKMGGNHNGRFNKKTKTNGNSEQ